VQISEFVLLNVINLIIQRPHSDMSNFNGSNWYSNKALLAMDQLYIPRQPAPSKQHDRNPKKKPIGQIPVPVASIQLEVNTRSDIFISSSSPTKRQRLTTPPSTPSRRMVRRFSATVSAGEDVIEIEDGHQPEAEVSPRGSQLGANAIEISTNARGGTSEKERMSSERQATEDVEMLREALDVAKKSSSPTTSIESSSELVEHFTPLQGTRTDKQQCLWNHQHGRILRGSRRAALCHS
jgi:hypothetical protein